MSDQPHYLTEEGLQKIERELQYLRTVRRTEVAERLHNALAEGGELGEDAEYEDAKNEQAFVEGEIARLENVLTNVTLITDDRPRDVVALGSKVTLREQGTDENEEYHIVGEAEADPTEGKISYKSPLGVAVMGHKKGDEIVVAAPDGNLVFDLVDLD